MSKLRVYLNPDDQVLRDLGLQNPSGIQLELNQCWEDDQVCDHYYSRFNPVQARCDQPTPPTLVGEIWPALHPKDWDLDELADQLGIRRIV